MTQTKSGGAFRHRRFRFELPFGLAEVVRNVVEGRVQLVADALHRANGSNSDKSGDQAILDGGRTLFVTNQLQKLAHGLRSLVQSAEACPRHLPSTCRMRATYRSTS